MDTDDLSKDAYDAIIIKSELFHHDLTLQFGLLAGRCDNEDEYLNRALLMIAEWESNCRYAIEHIFFDIAPRVEKFKSVLTELRDSIKIIQKIPIDKRTFEKW